MSQEPTKLFNQTAASSHDAKWAKLAPTRDALHLLVRAALAPLPADARILCVGVGTGPELLDLAQAFPGWQFTAVEPAGAMLVLCRKRAENAGIAARCVFHEGYLESLPETTPFDAATCFVVSQFLTDKEARRDLFKQIARRLGPQGVLVSSDISYDTSAPSYQTLYAVWRQMLVSADFSPSEADAMMLSWGQTIAILPPSELAELIASAGFDTPVQIFQSLLIHAWQARKAV